jgi:prepilin-type N-terminal cleavage/methylation domain-containing protein
VSPSRSSRVLAALRPRQTAESGFSMVEILVAISLLGLLGAAIVPMLITGLRASVVAKLDTGAKNLSQQRFELMRNLPFRIAYDPAVTTGVDMLDTYFPNLTAPTGGITTPGYVTTQARRTGEPATGPFYRKVFTSTLGSTDYTQYVATQFLTPDVTPKQAVTPPVGYSTTSTGNDRAPSTLVGVTIVTEWVYGTESKRLTVYSQISDVAPGAPLVTLQARAAALRVSSTVGLDVDQTDLLVESGTINVDGGLSSGATAASSAIGAFASSTPGLRVDGASRTASAPPDVAALTQTDNSAHQLLWNGSLVAEVPRSYVDGVAAKTSFGDPATGTAAAPVRSQSQGVTDLKFTNRPDLHLTDPALGLGYGYVVRQPAVASTLQSRSRAYSGSVGGTAHSSSVWLDSYVSDVQVLQTDFAPEGLVQMRLNSASTTCASNGVTATSTPTYEAQVRFLTYSYLSGAPALGTYSWSAWTTLNQSQTTDPLDTVNLTPGPGGVAVGYNGGRVVYLGEYVQGISSQTASTLSANKIISADFNRAESKSTTMVSLSTVPLRTGEPLSAVNVALGNLSCIAEDNR